MFNELQTIIDLSRSYGSNPDYVLAGGGNTSLKHDGTLYVKASGYPLATIGEEGFVKMSMDSLNAIWSKNYPDEVKAREAEVLADMMAARLEGETARPSVEALLHSLIKGKYVVHTHPGLINGLTCGKSGEAMTAEIFGDMAVWVPSVNPGYILAKEIRDRIEAAVSAGKPYPAILVLQNHGLFVSGESKEQIDSIHSEVTAELKARLKRTPVSLSDTKEIGDAALVGAFKSEAEAVLGGELFIKTAVNRDILAFAESETAFEPLSLPFNPDQIVYSGPGPLRLDKVTDFGSVYKKYMKRWNRKPGGALVAGEGLFAFDVTEKKTESARSLVLDSAAIAIYSESFGGPKPMTEEQIIFIRDWEVESYRASVQK